MGRSLESGKHHERCRFPGTRRPKHGEKFTPADRKIQVFDDKRLPVIAFLNAIEGHIAIV
jgi:hypothetical protein